MGAIVPHRILALARRIGRDLTAEPRNVIKSAYTGANALPPIPVAAPQVGLGMIAPSRSAKWDSLRPTMKQPSKKVGRCIGLNTGPVITRNGAVRPLDLIALNKCELGIL